MSDSLDPWRRAIADIEMDGLDEWAVVETYEWGVAQARARQRRQAEELAQRLLMQRRRMADPATWAHSEFEMM
jgi:ribosome-binding protein aMBF1 (putative translation factor)